MGGMCGTSVTLLVTTGGESVPPKINYIIHPVASKILGYIKILIG
jgi:hypothetical protein